MDPIEIWHDAPTFEVMETRIAVLEDALRIVRLYLIGRSWDYPVSPDEFIRTLLERK